MSSTHQPTWWNPIGALVYVPSKKQPGVLKFTTGSAHLHISRGDARDTWKVRWIINSKTGLVRGHCFFKTDQFLTAFRLLRKQPEATDAAYADRFGGEVGIPGLFIRFGRRLNIPCPGTGLPGDPNFSIKLTYLVERKIDEFVNQKK